jgi:periplasmic protein TonB
MFHFHFKAFVLCLLFIFPLESTVLAIDNSSDRYSVPDSLVYDQVDEQASFPGGINELKKFISTNLQYPASAKENGIVGKVILYITISDKGEIINIVVQKGMENCKECEEEAIRLVKSMPKWNPAKVRSTSVRSTAKVPVNFKLE